MKADFLHFYSGADLEQWLSELRFGEVLRLILSLPDPDSRFYSALNQPENEDLYILIFGDPAADTEATEADTAVAPSTPYQHVGLTEHLLMDLVDNVNRHRSEAAVKGTGKTPKRTKPYPRPVSQRDRILERSTNEGLDELARDLGFGDDL